MRAPDISHCAGVAHTSFDSRESVVFIAIARNNRCVEHSSAREKYTRLVATGGRPKRRLSNSV